VTQAKESRVGGASATEVEALRRLVTKFGSVQLTLDCHLASTRMKLRSLLSLKSESIVPLGRPVGSDLMVRVNGIQFARADVRIVNARVVLRLTEVGVDE
jgi:flagellar motor switch protein FliN